MPQPQQTFQERNIYYNSERGKCGIYQKKTSRRPKTTLMELGSSSAEKGGSVHGTTVRWTGLGFMGEGQEQKHGFKDKNRILIFLHQTCGRTCCDEMIPNHENIMTLNKGPRLVQTKSRPQSAAPT